MKKIFFSKIGILGIVLATVVLGFSATNKTIALTCSDSGDWDAGCPAVCDNGAGNPGGVFHFGGEPCDCAGGTCGPGNVGGGASDPNCNGGSYSYSCNSVCHCPAPVGGGGPDCKWVQQESQSCTSNNTGTRIVNVWCWDNTNNTTGNCCDPSTRPEDGVFNCGTIPPDVPGPNCYSDSDCFNGDSCSNATCNFPGAPNSTCAYSDNGTCTLGGSGYNCSNNQCVFTANNGTYNSYNSCVAAGCGLQSVKPGYNCINNSCQFVSSGALFSDITSCSASGCMTSSGNSVATGYQSSCPANNHVNISWAVTNTQNYTLFRAQTDGSGNNVGTPIVMTSGIGSGGTFTDTNLIPGLFYKYFFSFPYIVNVVNSANPGTDFGGTCPGTNTPPTTPTGGPTCNTSSASSCTGDSSPIACNSLRIVWTDNSTDEKGFRLYMDGSAQPFAAAPASSPSSATGQIMTYNLTLNDSNPHKFEVAAYNDSGESAKVAASNNNYASTACAANIGNSDKDIVAVNGNAVANVQPCNGKTDALSPTTNLLQYGDVVSFQINLCNSSNSVTVTNVSLVDSLTNLQMPSAGWGLQYFNGSGWVNLSSNCPASSSGQYCASGQQININLTSAAYNIPPQQVKNIRLNAKVALPGSSVLYGRFQNAVNFNSSAGSQNLNTPLILFYNGTDVPIREETRP